MDSFLREIKHISDSFAALNSPLTNQEVVQYPLDGLDDQYEVLATATTYFGSHPTFDDFHKKLIMYEPQVNHLHESSSAPSPHQALATTTTPTATGTSRNAIASSTFGRGCGGHWRGYRSHRGRNGG